MLIKVGVFLTSLMLFLTMLPPSAYTQDLDPELYQVANRDSIKNKKLKSITITSYRYEFGTLSKQSANEIKREEFDKEGNTTALYSSSEDKSLTFEVRSSYDKFNNLITEELRSHNGKVSDGYKKRLTYDKQNRKIQEVVSDPKGNTLYTKKYKYKDTLTTAEHEDTYDKKGKVTERIINIFDDNDIIQSSKYYDNQGQITKKKDYTFSNKEIAWVLTNADGEQIGERQVTYNAENDELSISEGINGNTEYEKKYIGNNLTELYQNNIRYKFSENRITETSRDAGTMKYEYDDNNNVTSITVNEGEDGNLVSTYMITLNENGLPKEKLVLNRLGEPEKTYKYVYEFYR